jgi:hypothetical protein
MQIERVDTDIATAADFSNLHAIEQFTKILNTEPPASSIQKTPDKRADTMPISFIEAKLDEVYLRQWGAEDVHVQQIANEVLIWLTLWVIDPQTKQRITRPGFAAVQITVDKVPDGMSGPDKNAWSLNMQNKKPNALYLAFPKGKSLAIKNAAQSLGVIFGRNLNRVHEDEPGEFYGNIAEGVASLTDAKKEVQSCRDKAAFQAVWAKYPNLHESDEFKKEYAYYHRKYVQS